MGLIPLQDKTRFNFFGTDGSRFIVFKVTTPIRDTLSDFMESRWILCSSIL